MKKYIKSDIVDVATEDQETRLALASDYTTSSRVLDRLVQNSNIHIQRAIACNPNTSAATLHKLVENGDYYTKLYVASNINTSADDLQMLYTTRNLDFLIALATNPNTPNDVIKSSISLLHKMYTKDTGSNTAYIRNFIDALIHNPSVPSADITKLKKLQAELGVYRDEIYIYFFRHEIPDYITLQEIQSAVLEVFTKLGYTIYKSWLEHDDNADIDTGEYSDELGVNCTHIINTLQQEYIEVTVSNLMYDFGCSDIDFDVVTRIYHDEN